MMFNFEVDSHKNCLKMVNLGYKIGHGKWQDPLEIAHKTYPVTCRHFLASFWLWNGSPRRHQYETLLIMLTFNTILPKQAE